MTVEGGDEMNARMTAAIAALAVLVLTACSPHAAESAQKPTPVHVAAWGEQAVRASTAIAAIAAVIRGFISSPP